MLSGLEAAEGLYSVIASSDSMVEPSAVSELREMLDACVDRDMGGAEDEAIPSEE